MRLFSRKRDWAVGPIERSPRDWVPPCPDLLEVAEDVAGSNRAAAHELADCWHRSLVGHAAANLGNVDLSHHYADLDKVLSRPDCTTELVYNFLLNLGAGGKAIAQDWRSMLFDDFVPAARKELGRNQ